MAAVAQLGPERNTVRISSGKREKSRNWAFTLNNYMQSDIKSLCEVKNEDYQYIFQEETGKEGTPHLQGTIILKNPQALSYMKKINGRAHWEICRNKFASINYCQKGLTRTGELFTNIDLPDLFDGTAHGTKVNKKPEVEFYKEVETMLYAHGIEIWDENSDLYNDIKNFTL